MGIVRRERSGGYFGGSKLIVPGQGILTYKKYNNFINKSGIKGENYDDIPLPTPTPTNTPTVTPTGTPEPTPTITLTSTPRPTVTPTPTPTKACLCVTFTRTFCRAGEVTYLDCRGNLNTTLLPRIGTLSVCADLSFAPLFNPSCVDMVINRTCSESPCV